MPATVSSLSSMSRNDMWQPEQPSSHTVARRFLLMQPTHATHSFIFLPHHRQVGQELPALEHLGDRASLFKESAGRTDMYALAATGAGFRGAPRFVQVGDDLSVDATAH